MSILSSAVLVVLTAVLVTYLPGWLVPGAPPAGGEGFAAPGWRKVADVFRENLDNGEEQGGAFALYLQGELVVEFWGGYADREARVPWSKETISQLFSATKFVGGLVVAMMEERGLLAYDKPVAHYWPEFAQNGKEKITVEQLVSHQAGLCVLDEQWSLGEGDSDPERMGQKLAAQKPHWEPGTSHGYHGMTFGLYIDQLVRRVDPQHRDISQFFAEEVAERFDLDFYLGLPKEENYRTARSYPFSIFSLDMLKAYEAWPLWWNTLTQPKSLASRMTTPETSDMNVLNNPAIRRITNPSNSGFATSTAAGKLMGIIANGGSMDGERLINQQAINKLRHPMYTPNPVDLVVGMNVTFGRGIMLKSNPMGDLIYGSPGFGGQMMFADSERKMGWAYITNDLKPFIPHKDPRYLRIEKAIYQAYKEVSLQKHSRNQ